MILTVPIFAASGQLEASEENWLFSNCAWSVPSAPGSRPTCSGVHVCRPLANPGFASMPSGSATVVCLMLSSASPPAASVVSCGTLIVTFNPVGVLARCSVGVTSIVGLNGSFWQPSSAGDVNFFSFHLGSPGAGLSSGSRRPGSAQESPSTDVLNGFVQSVGSVRYAGALGSSWGSQCRRGVKLVSKCPPSMHSQPRDWSWRGSPGTPQSVTRLLRVATDWGMLWRLTTAAYSPLGSTEVSITASTKSISKPNRAGSPGAGARLNTGTASVSAGSATGSLMDTTDTPTAVSPGQRVLPPIRSVENSKSEHCASDLVLASRPGGTVTYRSFASAGVDG